MTKEPRKKAFFLFILTCLNDTTSNTCMFIYSTIISKLFLKTVNLVKRHVVNFEFTSTQ